MDIENNSVMLDDGQWKRRALKEVGMDENLIEAADKEINFALKTVHSFIIIKNGCLIYEKYYNGFKAQHKAQIASVTKSIISSLIGIALDKGMINSIEQKVVDFFPEHKAKITDPLMNEITIKDLLTMTSGILWRVRAMREQMAMRMRKSPDWIEFVMTLPIDYGMRGKFVYNSSSSHMLSAILTKATGMSTREFANKYLFSAIGIDIVSDKPLPNEEAGLYQSPIWRSDFQWPTDPQGYNTGGFGLALKPIDLAKFGYLFLKNGVWQGERIISEDWVKASTTTKSEGNSNGTYGYQWWTNDEIVHKFFALGWGGQYIMVVPELDIVSVITSRADVSRWNSPGHLFDKYVIPAAN
jgi:CubicO group peptidase (beta-lactamase class C family)